MAFYNVAFSYNYTTISVGVELDTENEDEIIAEAIGLVAEEWGRDTRYYDDVRVEWIAE